MEKGNYVQISKSLVVFLLLFASFAEAKTWQKQVSVVYVMGESDSKVTARAAAMDKLKLLAAAEVGTYVESELSIGSDQVVKESVRTISASLVRLSQVSDVVSIEKSGVMNLVLSANADVDEDELRKRIDSLQQDKQKAEQVARLTEQNRLLQEELLRIQSGLASAQESANVAILIAQQGATLRKVEENNRAVSQVFAAGTLFAMANTYQTELDNAKQEIQRQVIDPILSMPVTTNIESVSMGEKFAKVRVRVGWKMPKGVESTLNKWFKNSTGIGRSNYQFNIAKNKNTAGSTIKPQTSDLYYWLVDQIIFLQISLANAKATIPIKVNLNAEWNITQGAGNGMRILLAQSSLEERIENIYRKSWDLQTQRDYPSKNPVELIIPVEAAKTATSIDYKIIFQDKHPTGYTKNWW